MVPDRIMNPEMFAYDFQRTEGGILCTRTIYWSASKTYTGSFLMPEKELKKMEEHGMTFAGFTAVQNTESAHFTENTSRETEAEHDISACSS